MLSVILFWKGENQETMWKIVKNITKKVIDSLREIVNDELKSIDAFYQQFA